MFSIDKLLLKASPESRIAGLFLELTSSYRELNSGKLSILLPSRYSALAPPEESSQIGSNRLGPYYSY